MFVFVDIAFFVKTVVIAQAPPPEAAVFVAPDIDGLCRTTY